MAVIDVVSTDTGDGIVNWSVPPDNVLNETGIPRGVRVYNGSVAVPALGIGDETAVNITFTFPTAYSYLCKSLNLRFQSDDETTEFDRQGVLLYTDGQQLGYQYALDSPGPAFVKSAGIMKSIDVYHPVGTWRQWISGGRGDTMNLTLADISSDASTAGDVFWRVEFWEYDLEQCFNWQVNRETQILVSSN